MANFSGCTINNAGTGYTLVATDTTNPAVLSTTSSPFNVAAQALTSFQVSPRNPGCRTPVQRDHHGPDQAGYKFTGYTGTQTLTFSGPSSSPSPTAPIYPAGTVTFSGGVGTALVTLYNARDDQPDRCPGQRGTAPRAASRVNPLAAPVSFTVSNPGTQTAGTAFTETITAADPYGNTATGYTGSHTLTFSGPSNAPNGQAPSYPGQVNFTSGVGTATITLYDAQSTTLTATARPRPSRAPRPASRSTPERRARSRCRTPAPRRRALRST